MIARLGWCPRGAQEQAEHALLAARASLDNARDHLDVSRALASRTRRALQENHLREAAEFSLELKRRDTHD